MQSLITPDDIKLPENIAGIRCQFNGEDKKHKAIFRFLRTGTVEDLSLAQLGYNERHLRHLKKMRSFPSGITFITGPTGHGKSLTLKVQMDTLLEENNYQMNLMTAESPVEYIIAGADQNAVKEGQSEEETNRNYAEMLRKLLRSDPDALMVGEVRDIDTGEITLRAAITGHPAATSLHVNNALVTPTRLEDMGLKDFLCYDADIVVGLVAQRLVQVLCEDCKVPIDEARNFPDDTLARLEPLLALNLPIFTKSGSKDCPTCKGRGFTGRTVIAETVLPNHKLMAALKAKKAEEAQHVWLNELEGQTMAEHGLEKIIAGTVDPRQVEKHCGYVDVDIDRLKTLEIIPSQLENIAS